MTTRSGAVARAFPEGKAPLDFRDSGQGSNVFAILLRGALEIGDIAAQQLDRLGEGFMAFLDAAIRRIEAFDRGFQDGMKVEAIFGHIPYCR